MDRLSALIARLDQLPVNGPYHALLAPLAETTIEERRALLFGLATQLEARIGWMQLPPSIQTVYRQDAQRILRTSASEPDAYFELHHDAFVKDVGIVTQRVIPAGAEVLTIAGIPRGWLLRARGRTALRAGWRFLTAGGFAPFLEYHTHDRVLQNFNEAGFRAFYRRVADWLDRRSDLKGVFARTWFLDPALETVSPRLAYLRRIPVIEGGALEIDVGTVPQDVELATLKSATRRALYARGEYQPTAYVNVWFRKDLLRWAHRQPF